MNAKKILVLTAIAAAVLAASCSVTSSKKLIKQGLYKCSERLELAAQRIEKRGYADAIRILDEIKYQCGGSPLMDTVYYYAGISHLRLKQYDEARDEFENLYREHPRSPFMDEGQYRLAQMRFLQSNLWYRDQTETREAMRLFSDYMDLYPKGAYIDSARALFKTSMDRLAEKEFNNALFYRKQKENEAALIYYRAVLAEYPESKFAPESVVGMAEVLVALGRTQDARDILEELDSAAFDDALKGRIEAVKQTIFTPTATPTATVGGNG